MKPVIPHTVDPGLIPECVHACAIHGACLHSHMGAASRGQRVVCVCVSFPAIPSGLPIVRLRYVSPVPGVPVHIFLVWRYYVQRTSFGGPQFPPVRNVCNSKGLLGGGGRAVYAHKNAPSVFVQGNKGHCCYSVLTFSKPLGSVSI